MIELLKEMKKEEYEEICRRDEYFTYLESIKKLTTYLEKEAIK